MSVSLECETQHGVINHANISNGTKITTFFGKSWGMMLYLSNAPLRLELIIFDYLTPARFDSQNVMHSNETGY